MKKPRVVALVPMKFHSERVSGKNFRDFCGKPLFRWILDTVLATPEIAEVVINTDASTRLAELGLFSDSRVKIRERRRELCGDHVSMNAIIADDIENIAADIYVMTHTTNPLLSTGTVERALSTFGEAFAAGRADSLFTVDRLHSRFYDSGARPINHDPNSLIPTQELEPWFKENSNLYVFTAASFASTNARIGLRPVMLETPLLEAIDIDTPADWQLAEAIAMYLRMRDTCHV